MKAEAGEAATQHKLDMCYYLGEGVAQDYAKAYFWLDLAAAAKIEGVEQENIKAFQDVIDKFKTPLPHT